MAIGTTKFIGVSPPAQGRDLRPGAPRRGLARWLGHSRPIERLQRLSQLPQSYLAFRQERTAAAPAASVIAPSGGHGCRPRPPACPALPPCRAEGRVGRTEGPAKSPRRSTPRPASAHSLKLRRGSDDDLEPTAPAIEDAAAYLTLNVGQEAAWAFSGF
jgi:hypothetical protein